MKKHALQHPKLFALTAELSISRPEAIGFLTLLWNSTADYAPQGDIGRFGNEVIAKYCDWTGDADQFIDGLIKTGWLDRCDQFRLLVHDWKDHTENWVRAKLKKADLPYASDLRRDLSGDLKCGSLEARLGGAGQGIGKEDAESDTARELVIPALPTDIEFPEKLASAKCAEALTNWLLHSQDNGKNLSRLSAEALLRQFAPHGPDAFVAAVDSAIASGWKNLREPSPSDDLCGAESDDDRALQLEREHSQKLIAEKKAAMVASGRSSA